MELRVLKYFLAVAREETVVGAAEALHVTQPTLSRQIIELENELGCKLFVRGNRKISLTEEGMFLRKRAQEIIDLVDKTQADFQMTDEIVSGDVYIGSGETDAFRMIARTVKRLHETNPLIRYHMFSGSAEIVTERLDRGLLDFGIVIEPVTLSKYDYCKIPAVDTWGLLMRKDDPLAEKDGITPSDLEELPLLCSRQMLSESGLTGWLDKSSDRYNIVSTYNLIYNAALMVEEKVGYALTLDKLVNTSGDSKLCFVPLRPKLEVTLDLVWKKYQVFSKAAKKFLDCLQTEIKMNM